MYPPLTFLTPADNAALGEWCPHHAYDPTEPTPPFRIAYELTDPILDALHPEEGESSRAQANMVQGLLTDRSTLDQVTTSVHYQPHLHGDGTTT